MSFNRIYVNAQRVNTSSTKNKFQVSLSANVTKIEDLNLSTFTFIYTPINSFPIYESQVDVTENGSTNGSFQIDTLKVYDSPDTSSGTSLISELDSKWSAAGLTGSWLYDHTYQRVYLSGLVPNTTTLVLNKVNNQAYRRLGFSTDQLGVVIIADADGNITANCPPILARTSTSYLALDISTDSISSDASVNNIIAQIPLYSVAYGSIANFEIAYNFSKISGIPPVLHTLNFSLLDDQFQPLELCENSNVMAEFHIDHEGNEDIKTKLLRMTKDEF